MTKETAIVSKQLFDYVVDENIVEFDRAFRDILIDKIDNIVENYKTFYYQSLYENKIQEEMKMSMNMNDNKCVMSMNGMDMAMDPDGTMSMSMSDDMMSQMMGGKKMKGMKKMPMSEAEEEDDEDVDPKKKKFVAAVKLKKVNPDEVEIEDEE